VTGFHEPTELVGVIERNAALAVANFGPLVDFEFGLDRRSVEWVDGFIERQRVRTDLDPTAPGGLVDVLGSFVGACLVAETAGRWHAHPEHGVGVRFPDGSVCFPFAKVRKQFADGNEGGESVSSFYRLAVDYVATGKLKRADGG
jgi:hypothetical protein